MCDSEKTAKLTNTVFFKISLKPYQRPIKNEEKKYEKYKEQRVNSIRFPQMNQVFSKYVIA